MSSWQIPPYPVLSTPFLLEFATVLLDALGKKYNIDLRMVPVPYPSPTVSPSTSNGYSNPSTPEKKSGSGSPNTICHCAICGKQFSRQWLLQGHLRTHTGEKPFKCEICAKTFADKSNLRAHVQTHSGEKPHKCSRCGKRFALKSYLSKHEESKCVRRFGWPC